MKKILKFEADWCVSCKSLSKVLEQIETNIPIEVIDIDVNPEIATEFGIRSVPTLVLMEDNMASKRLVGNKTIQELEAFIND